MTSRISPASMVLVAAATLWLATPAHAQVTDPQVEFTVVKANTLIGLSREILVTPNAWHEVARINHLADPDVILPGQVLRIPVRLLRTTPQGAKIVSSIGDVRVGDTPVPPTAAGSNSPLAQGQTVQTGPQSSAVIELADEIGRAHV